MFLFGFLYTLSPYLANTLVHLDQATRPQFGRGILFGFLLPKSTFTSLLYRMGDFGVWLLLISCILAAAVLCLIPLYKEDFQFIFPDG